MSIKNHFPFKEFRENQGEVLDWIYSEFMKGIDVVIVEAPVGFGKSPVGYATGMWCRNAFYVTPLIVLQKQLAREEAFEGLKEVFGRDNYLCNEDKKLSAGNAPCTVVKNYKCTASECDYLVSRDKAQEAHIACLNLAYLFTVSDFVFPKRDLMIVDEGHNIDSWVLNYVTVTFSKKEFGFVPPVDSFPDIIEWIKKQGLIKLKELMLKNEKLMKEKPSEKKYRQGYKYYFMMLERVKTMIKDWDYYGDSWIVYQNEKRMQLKPVKPARFMEHFIWNKADKILIMSGSILNIDMFLSEIGLNDKKCAYTKIPMSFPVTNRPIYYKPQGNMKFDQRDKSLPNQMHFIRDLVKTKYLSCNGIVHCHSYDIAMYLNYYLKSNINVMLQDKYDRSGSLERFLEVKEPTLFLSVNMTDGIDLKYDLARYQILVKTPYPDIKDNRTKARMDMKDGWTWYNWQVAKSVVQAYGRGIRAEDDWCDFYITDSGFYSFWKRCKWLFPDWFKEAIVK